MKALYRISSVLGFIAYIGLFVWMFWLMPVVEVEVVVEVPMSVSDTQRFLKAEGLYDGKIDNDWGPGTERAWCDYMAMKSWPVKKGE